MWRSIVLVAFLGISLSFPSTLHAGRVVLFEILLDGKLILTAQKLDDGSNTADQAWQGLSSMRFENPAKTYVQTDTEHARLIQFHETLKKQTNQGKVVLKGKIRIFCRYAGDATIESLTLIQSKNGEGWTIAPEVVKDLANKRRVDKEMRTREQLDEADKVQNK